MPLHMDVPGLFHPPKYLIAPESLFHTFNGADTVTFANGGCAGESSPHLYGDNTVTR
jgi:hypothetical protein